VVLPQPASTAASTRAAAALIQKLLFFKILTLGILPPAGGSKISAARTIIHRNQNRIAKQAPGETETHEPEPVFARDFDSRSITKQPAAAVPAKRTAAGRVLLH
jgi:pSer/pThr/pTyr-binding forkhead associated (FHA) protein